MLQTRDRQPKKIVDFAHPTSIPTRKIVIHSNDVNAGAIQGIKVGRQGRDKRLTLTRFHLGDLAVMENRAAYQLDIEVTFT